MASNENWFLRDIQANVRKEEQKYQGLIVLNFILLKNYLRNILVNNQQPRPEGTGYVVLVRYMSSCPRARGYIPLISALKGGVCTLRIQSKIIEIGCGTGYYGLFLHDKCKEYIGVDITSENINLFNEKIEQEKIQNIITIVGDGTNLKGINSKTLSQ